MQRSLAVTQRMAARNSNKDFTRTGMVRAGAVAGESGRVILSLVLVLGLIGPGATVP